MSRDEFVRKIADNAGVFTVEHFLEEAVLRLAERGDYTLAPRIAALVLNTIYEDVQRGKALFKSREAAELAARYSEPSGE